MMGRSVNRVFLIGNVGAEPEIRATSNGTRVARVSLATNRPYTTAAGEKREDVQWHRLNLWGKLADIAEQWIGKGDRLYVEGRIEYSKVTGDDGVDRFYTDIHVQELVMLGATNDPAKATGRASGDSNLPEPPAPQLDDADLPF